MKTLSIIHNTQLNGVTTFNFTLSAAVMKISDSSAEFVSLNPTTDGFDQKFIDAGIVERSAGSITYDAVFINNRSGLNWCVNNGIQASKYFFFVHSVPVESDLQKEVLPPMAAGVESMFGGKLQIVAFSETVQGYLEGLGHTVTKTINGVDLSRFKKSAAPEAINKVLLFDLRNNLAYSIKMQSLVNALPLSYIRTVSKPIWNIEEEIAAADLVVAYGRCAIEAAAMGKPVIIYGINGGDGLITSENKEVLAETNFSGWSVRSLPLPENLFEGTILQEMARYVSTDTDAVAGWIASNYGIDQVVLDLGLNAV